MSNKKKMCTLLVVGSLLLTLLAVVFTGGCETSTDETTPPPTDGTTTPPPEVIHWTGQSLLGTGDLTWDMQLPIFMDTIYEETDGQLEIEMFLPDALVPVPEQFDALSQGVFEVIATAFPFDAQWLPEAMVAYSLPGSWQSLDQALKFFLDYGAWDLFKEAYAEQNQYLLGYIPWGPFIMMTTDPVNEWSDMQGMSFWAEPPNDILFAALGGSPTWLPPADLYMGLKLGTVDGCGYTPAELKTMNLYEVVNYVYFPPLEDYIFGGITINLDAWNSLSPELQNQIETLMWEEISPEMATVYAAQTQAGLDFFEEHGGEIVYLSPDMAAEMVSRSRGTWDEVAAASDRTAQLVELLRDFLEAEGIGAD
jgi:TRAP-type C4-dicarboxylate transport system substrate-binding protein